MNKPNMTRQQMIEHLEFIVRHLQSAIEELADPACVDPPCLDDADAAMSELYNAIEEGNFSL